MSLLMEALRQVEQAKKQAAGGVTRPVAPAEVTDHSPSSGDDDRAVAGVDENGKQGLSLVLADESGDSSVAEGVEETSPAFSEPEPEIVEEVPAPATAASVQPHAAGPVESAPSQSVAEPATERRSSAFSPEASRQAARTVFAAKQEYQRRVRNRRLLVLGMTAGLVLSGVAGFFYLVYRSTVSPGNSLTLPGDHAIALRADKEGPSAPEPDGSSPLPVPSPGQGVPDGAAGPEVQGGGPASPGPAPVLPQTPSVSSPSDSPFPPVEPSRPVAAVSPPVSIGGVAIPGGPGANQNPGCPAGLDAPGQGRSGGPLPGDGAGEDLPAQTPDMTMAPAQAIPASIVIKHRTARPKAGSLITSAYDAYQRGDYAEARTGYQQVLLADPKNRNALLAMAAIALQGQEVAQARDFYLRLLDQDPGDPLARAGLLAMAPSGDPAEQESELKLLLEQHPKSAPLFFSLGNLYAAGQRWNEAQQAYFNALQVARENAAVHHAPSLAGQPSAPVVHPDYPFNLAVSLEHLGKIKPAVNFYREALQLAEGRPAGFDPEALRARLQTLEQGEAP